MGWRDTQTLAPDDGNGRVRWLQLSGVRNYTAGSTMVWLLGTMACLLCGAGIWLIMEQFWGGMDSLVRVLSLTGILVAMWLAYALFARGGWVSREVTGLLLCVSCLLSVLCLRQALPGLQPWFLGLIFLGGVMLVLTLLPGRVAVIVLALACLGELGLLWVTMHDARDVASWALLWTCVLSILMVWGISGGWCAVSMRSGYSTFGVISPIAFVLYLLVYHGMLVYPDFLRPADLEGTIVPGQWIGMMVIWMVPMGFLLRLQYARARRTGKPCYAPSFLLYYVVTVLSLPVGLMLLELRMPVLEISILFGYAGCIVYYGADYRMSYFVVLGSLLAFITAIGIPVGVGVSALWSAVVMLVLAGAFLAGALALSRNRDNLLQEPTRGTVLGHAVVRRRPATQEVSLNQPAQSGMAQTIEPDLPLSASSGSTTTFTAAPYVPPLQVPPLPQAGQAVSPLPVTTSAPGVIPPPSLSVPLPPSNRTSPDQSLRVPPLPRVPSPPNAPVAKATRSAGMPASGGHAPDA